MSISNFEEVMGIKDGGEEISLRTSHKSNLELTEALVGKMLRLTLFDMEKQLKICQHANDLFVARFSLITLVSKDLDV